MVKEVLKEFYKDTIPDRRVTNQAVVRGVDEGALALPDFGVSEKRGQKENNTRCIFQRNL